MSDRKDKASAYWPRTLIWHQNTCRCANFYTVWWAGLKLLIRQWGQYSSADQWDGCGSPWSLLYMDRVEWGPLISVFTKWWFTLQKASSFKVHILHLVPQGACFERAAQASVSPVCPCWRQTVPIKDLVHRGFHDLLLVSLQWRNLPLASFLWPVSDPSSGNIQWSSM